MAVAGILNLGSEELGKLSSKDILQILMSRASIHCVLSARLRIWGTAGGLNLSTGDRDQNLEGVFECFKTELDENRAIQ